MVIKLSSYTESIPNTNCNIKVAIKLDDFEKFKGNSQFATQVIENALYEDGFVSIDGGKSYFLASNFLFHKLKRKRA